MKIIVAGGGKVGSTLVRQLSAEGYDVTLIDHTRHTLETQVEQYDVLGYQGNCAAKETLVEAGIRDADLLIAATGMDEVNLLCCLTAHGLNADLHTIARIRNPEYTEQLYSMRELFALSMAVNPERQAAREIERLLKFPGFLRRDTFARGRVEIVELRVDSDSPLCNVALSDLNSIVKCQVLVCTVLRDDTAIIPGGNFVLQAGDRIFVTASTNTLAQLLKNLGIITHKAKRVMLCGGGRVSFYLAQLLQKSGITVQLIEKDYEECVQLSAALPSVCVIHGDASDHALLQREGLEECDALVALTGSDELNMVISLYANRCGVPQIITKLSRSETTGIFSNLSIGSVVCPKELCCNSITRYVRAMKNQTGAATAVHSIADGKMEAMEFVVDETTLHHGTPLKQLKLRRGVLIVCISRGGKTELPNGDSTFEVGDRLIVVADEQQILTQLNDMFE